jgi:hypothetical protein
MSSLSIARECTLPDHQQATHGRRLVNHQDRSQMEKVEK